MTKTALLVVTKPNLALTLLPKIKSFIKNKLYILLLSENRLRNIETNVTNRKLGSGAKHSTSVVTLYTDALNSKIDVRVLLVGLRGTALTDIYTRNKIEVIYLDRLLNNSEQRTSITNKVRSKISDCEVIPIGDLDISGSSTTKTSDYICPIPDATFNEVVLGGTFDRLHAGHKILLSEAILHCQKKLTVGVTDNTMLNSKTLWELIEPCSVRMQNVKDFLVEVEPRLEYNVVPISDMYGPTKDVPEFEMIIVSEETKKGGDKVNDIRKQNGLNPLVIHTVPLFLEEHKLDDLEEDKISSSNSRMRLLGTLLRPVTPKPHLPVKPYIIGLSGGIATGKSTVSDFLASQGAVVFNADLIAHRAYDVGTPCYKKIVEHFGKRILGEDGAINRQALGAIVFNDKAELEKLNGLVWPSLMDILKEKIKKAGENGANVVVIEAAVLRQAGWQNECHEIWTTILPTEEAATRLQNRNNLTKEEALKRITAQPSNVEQLEISNVVFCTLWKKSHVESQVQRAWCELCHRLPDVFNSSSNL